MFKGFRDEDYWIVSAAQRVAAERVYPAIATFAKQLNERVPEVGLRWGPSEQGVVNYHSTSLQYPHEWARSYIQLPYWAKDWPERRGFWATLHVLFDFLDSSVAIGYLQKVPSVAMARKRWLPTVEELTAAIVSLPESYGSHIQPRTASCSRRRCVKTDQLPRIRSTHCWYDASVSILACPIAPLRKRVTQ